MQTTPSPPLSSRAASLVYTIAVNNRDPTKNKVEGKGQDLKFSSLHIHHSKCVLALTHRNINTNVCTHHRHKKWTDQLKEELKLFILSIYDMSNFARPYKVLKYK